MSSRARMYRAWMCLNGSPVMFESKRQESVATSTAEAEIMALSAAVEDPLFLHQLVGSVVTVELPMVVYEDNHACIYALSNPAAHGRTRHIHAPYMRASELIQAAHQFTKWPQQQRR
jgi:hypothetical protein